MPKHPEPTYCPKCQKAKKGAKLFMVTTILTNESEVTTKRICDHCGHKAAKVEKVK